MRVMETRVNSRYFFQSSNDGPLQLSDKLFNGHFVARGRCLICDDNHTALMTKSIYEFGHKITSILSDRDSTEHLSGAIFGPEDSISIEEEAGSKASFVWEQITNYL